MRSHCVGYPQCLAEVLLWVACRKPAALFAVLVSCLSMRHIFTHLCRERESNASLELMTLLCIILSVLAVVSYFRSSSL